MSRLKISDKVIWRGSWGADEPQEAIIDGIELCGKGKKNGKTVKSVAWKTIKDEKRKDRKSVV